MVLNNPYNLRHDKLSVGVFNMDYDAMKESDFGIVSLPIGEDCSSEIGWYAGNSKPIYCIIRTMQEKARFMEFSPLRIQQLKSKSTCRTQADTIRRINWLLYSGANAPSHVARSNESPPLPQR